MFQKRTKKKRFHAHLTPVLTLKWNTDLLSWLVYSSSENVPIHASTNNISQTTWFGINSRFRNLTWDTHVIAVYTIILLHSDGGLQYCSKTSFSKSHINFDSFFFRGGWLGCSSHLIYLVNESTFFAFFIQEHEMSLFFFDGRISEVVWL